VRDADAGDDDRRGAQGGGGEVEVIEEANSGAEEDGGYVDVELVDEAGFEELLDGVGAVDAKRLTGGGSFAEA
jgi:hypothetical protein